MKRQLFVFITIILVSLLFFPMTSSIVRAQTTEPVVHAVLLYSPTCPHCHKVITEDLPPLFEKYGDKLDMIGIDVSQPGGQAIYQAAIQRFSIPENRLGVPTLIIDNIVLVGSLEIPEQFPGLIEQYLAQGGVDWPDISGLSEILPLSQPEEDSTATDTSKSTIDPPTNTDSTQSAALQTTPIPATISPTIPAPTSTPGLVLTDSQNPGWRDNFTRDPAGNTLAIFVLASMLIAFLWIIIALFRNQTESSPKRNWSWLIPILCVVGFGVAGYLAYVETAQVTAMCGPVGDCNTVQQSEYARLFGILPIGVLGLIGYIAIGLVWLIARYFDGYLADLAVISLFIMTAFGTLFSIYLTFLEPFVIGATCAWCLTSAILITTLMVLSVKPAKSIISNIITTDSSHRNKKLIGANND